MSSIGYCFKYTKRDIENDWRENGRSLIYRKVAAEKKSGRCNCATLNPKGR
ncbi:MAG: BFD-like (2Fe-2S) protein [Deltaproteobacteria bacterium HGW-Deltaproteobacteria-15]|nr:MAG: BFD-like (2Fe-2S) protein [Deltaproteobacteria bacterium HGW-Deltaproteobacteria-15]